MTAEHQGIVWLRQFFDPPLVDPPRSLRDDEVYLLAQLGCWDELAESMTMLTDYQLDLVIYGALVDSVEAALDEVSHWAGQPRSDRPHWAEGPAWERMTRQLGNGRNPSPRDLEQLWGEAWRAGPPDGWFWDYDPDEHPHAR